MAGECILVDWSPDGKHIVSGSFDKTARIWSPDGGATSAILTGHTQDVSGVAWSPDGRTVATTSDKSVRLWEPDGRFRYGWYDLESHGQFVAFSDDSRQLLYSWGDRNTGKHGTAIFDAIDGHHRSQFYRHVTTPMDGLFTAGRRGGPRSGRLAIFGCGKPAMARWCVGYAARDG